MANYGVPENDGVSEYLKVMVQVGNDVVIGYIGEGSTKQLSTMWQSPFEGDTVGQAGGIGSKVMDVAQAHSGITSKGVMNTMIVWDGTSPMKLMLTINLKAYNNPQNEVDKAIMMLEAFSSPDLSNTVGLGGIPLTCAVNIGRKVILKDCHIEDVSSELDAPRDKDGYMTRNTVSLSITTSKMINKTEISNIYK